MDELQAYGATERFYNEATLHEGLTLGRIIAQYQGLYKIVTRAGEALAELSGKLRHSIQELAQYPAVGDFVMVAKEAADERAVIRHVLTRKSVFLRTAVGVSGQAQVVAANIDLVFVCMSLNQNFNLSRMERYLSIAWDSGATPVVVLTKADLCEDLPGLVTQVEEIAGFAEVVTTSALEEDGVEKVRPYLKPGVTAAFIGSSGVGKSTLINRLLGEAALDTQAVGRGDKGRHTTTGREMYPCPGGGVLMDTPGMRELGAQSADLSKSFADLEELAAQCRYSDCTHTAEPGCAFLRAVEEGELDQRRLDSYRKLKVESGYEGLNSREIEEKKLQRMFKEVGGMKNARKTLKENPKYRT